MRLSSKEEKPDWKAPLKGGLGELVSTDEVAKKVVAALSSD